MSEIATCNELGVASAEIFVQDNGFHTSLSNVQVIGQGKVTMKITRPQVQGMPDGYVYLFERDLNGKLLERQLVSGNTDTLYTLQTNNAELTDGDYILGYGPNWTDDVNVLAATVQLSSGSAFNSEPSLFSNISKSIQVITSHYSIPNGVLGYNAGSIRAILREGDQITGTGTALATQTIQKGSTDSGVITLEPGTYLKHGSTYHVGLYVYSTWRFVAGYIFTLPE